MLFITFENSSAVKKALCALKNVDGKPETHELKLFKHLKLAKTEDPSLIRIRNYSVYEANPIGVWRRILGYQALIFVLFGASMVIIHADLWWLARISAEYGNRD